MELNVSAYSFWTPSFDQNFENKMVLGQDQENQNNKAKCTQVKPMVRRRFSQLTASVIFTAQDILQKMEPEERQKTVVVLASRHGEIQTLTKLFNQLCQDEPLSPTSFSTSVHHSAVGYLSLIEGLKGSVRTVANNIGSASEGLLEAFSLNKKYPKQPILLVFADEKIPSELIQDQKIEDSAFAMSFLLNSSIKNTGQISFSASNGLEQKNDSSLDLLNAINTKKDFIINTLYGEFKWKTL